MPGYWRKWSSQWSWVARAEARDEWQYEREASARLDSELRIRAEQIAEEERQAKSRLGQLRVGRTAAAAFLNKLAKAFIPVAQNGTGELLAMSPKEMLQHVGKVGALLVGCIAEERRELAATGGQQSEDARKATDEVKELARDVLSQMERMLGEDEASRAPAVLVVPGGVEQLAREYSDGDSGSNGDGRAGADA